MCTWPRALPVIIDQLIGAARPAARRRAGGGKVAELLESRGRLGLRSGTVIGVPVPEHLVAAGEEVEAATRQVGLSSLLPPPLPSSQLSRYFSPLSHLLPSLRPLHPYLCSLLPSLLPRPNSSSLSVPLCHWCLVATSFFCRAPARRPKQLRGAEPVRSVTP